MIPTSNRIDRALLEERIETNRISAITCDASIFGQYQYGFNRYPLSALKSLAEKGVNIVLSDIVFNALKRHFNDLAKDTLLELERKLRTAASIWDIDEEQKSRMIKLLSVSERRIDGALRNAMKELAVSVINLHDYVPASDAKYIKSYALPEHKSCNKFSQIILKSLSAWAQRHDTGVLVVSANDAWLKHCADFENLYGVASLKRALSLFHKDCRPASEEIVDRMRSGDLDHILDELRVIFRKHVRNTSFIPTTQTPGHVKGEIDAVELSDIDFNLDSSRLVPVEHSSSTLKLSMDLALWLEVYASFSFYRLEQPDEYTFQGSTKESVFTMRQKAGVILVFTNENGKWIYSGLEHPSVCESIQLDAELNLLTDGILEDYYCLLD